MSATRSRLRVFKVLTWRTLRALRDGEPSYWRLSDPLRWPLGIRGSILAELDVGFVRTRLDRLGHWCPLDSGGVRLGYQRAPAGLATEDLLLGADSLAGLICLGASRTVADAVTAGQPLWTVLAGSPEGAAVLEAFRGGAVPPYGWTYEVFLQAAPPPRPGEVVALHCPNTAAEAVAELMGPGFDDAIRPYNPRWGLERVPVA